MTGFGDARHQDDRVAISAEIRTVNNRYLKVNIKCPDVYAALEGEIERVIRERISRGTVSVAIRVDRLGTSEDYSLNMVALESYWRQLVGAAERVRSPQIGDLGSLLLLPGVVSDDSRRSIDVDSDWRIMKGLLDVALKKLQEFRIEEGRSMQQDLAANGRIIADRLEEVIRLAPQVVSEYRTRMLERVRQVLADTEVQVSEVDLLREVSIFSDRSDINEEITRLKCHLDQYQAFLNESVSAGRKLEFLSQEIFREVNTIGSKANSVAIAHAVVEMKAAVEKIREVLQNVE